MAWAAHSKNTPLTLTEFQLKTWNEDDVDIDITDSGICRSDIHTIDSSWGDSDYPVVPGHEFVGTISRVGKNVSKFKVGDRVGLGPLCYSCGECSSCSEDVPNCCKSGFYGTYNCRLPNGEKTYGGYTTKWRGNMNFVVKIPDNVTSENACTMLCAGVTTYAPLKRWNTDATSSVGVMGLGGLGHFGVLFAKALGAKVTVLSHSEVKRQVAFELGADDYVNTSDPKQMDKLRGSLTHLLCTGMGKNFKWETILPLIKANGVFINLALPTFDLPAIPVFQFTTSQIAIASSFVGSPKEAEEMFQLVSRKKIKAWYQTYPMHEVNRAIEDFKAGKPRFRYVLKN
ncbi:GroES-like protein [Backusella circina FSU 941]|nr:GroES-like protein [Backusella circina FSU 941]